MEAVKTGVQPRDYEVRAWEFNLLLIEIVLFAGIAVGWTFSLGPQALGADVPWADAAWKGLGFFLLGLAIYPVLRIQSRHARGRELRFSRWNAGALLAAAAGALIYFLLP